jgi:molybdopterin-dependent oxidoreductase alpha subunit
MNDTLRETPLAQPPIDDQDIRLGKPSAAAGGVEAVVATVRYAARQTGLLRGARVLARTNQDPGFDCPGCAWPEPRHRAAIEFCENGAKAVLSEATTRRADPSLFAKWSVAELAEQSDAWLNDQGRLVHPMVLRRGASHYEPITWDDAFALLAQELSDLSSPDEAIFYTSGRTSNEAAFLYQLFARAFGTNNLPDCSNMCHESSGAGLKETIGVGKGTVQLEDFEVADAIFVVGQNPGTNHPRMLTTLEAAAKRGATIVSVNPLLEVGTTRFAHPQNVLGLLGEATPIARMHVPVRINGDVAFFQGMMKTLLEEEERAPGTVIDRGFIDAFTEGYDELVRALKSRTWAELEAASGVSEDEMRAAGRVGIESRATIVTWAMGLTQHVNAVDNVQAIVDFLLMRGMIGKPGAGACPVRGHSNVQGDRTMGIWEKMPDAWLDRLGRELSFEPPRAHGVDTVGAIRACARLLRARRQLPERGPGHGANGGGTAQVHAHRPRVDQASPRPPGDGQTSAHPSLSSEDGGRPPGGNRAVRERRELDGGGPRFERLPRASRRHAAERAAHHRPAREQDPGRGATKD